MTLTLLTTDNQHRTIVSIIFSNISEELRIITESTNDEQISGFICPHESSKSSFIEVPFEKPPPVLIKKQDGTFQMTTIFLDINDELHIIKCLINNNRTKSFRIDTEKLET